MIRLDHVFKQYPNDREALYDVSFAVNAGEFVFLTGRSGAGKSSILKLLTLIELPTRGTVTVNGQKTNELPSRAIPAFRRRLGVVFQDHQLLMNRPVYDNIALPLMVSDTRFRDIDKRVRAALDQVDLLGKEHVSPAELSIGEQQRVGIARAVVARPTVLIADEPTGNLDPGNTWEIMRILLKINELGTTVILATHSKEVIDKISRRVITIEEGVVSRDEKNGKYRLE